MDKISELKEKLCRSSFVPAKNKYGEPMTQLVGQNPNGWGKHSKSFNKGFDAAMKLQLPIKFAEWKDGNWIEYEDKKGQYHEKLRVSKPKTLVELFNYWRDNIYQPIKQ